MYSNIKKTEIVFYFYFQEIMELEEMSYSEEENKVGLLRLSIVQISTTM